ncbi:hypothetical protein NDU88_005615 [Pleurodeles waltl]|uniref:Uncharacterized protein n=1 Tax=Pleurodeles waltl TaxID=8319 RepID=A0AAV7L9W7_PLEWA|nr:hypothetical protein NDU88_005615 [Pleurodeles waltl]
MGRLTAQGDPKMCPLQTLRAPSPSAKKPQFVGKLMLPLRERLPLAGTCYFRARFCALARDCPFSPLQLCPGTAVPEAPGAPCLLLGALRLALARRLLPASDEN